MGNVRRARNFGGNVGAQPGDDHPLPGPADQEDLRPEPSGSRAGSSALLTTRLSDGSQGNGSLVDNRVSRHLGAILREWTAGAHRSTATRAESVDSRGQPDSQP